MASIFLSYASEDRQAARSIGDALAEPQPAKKKRSVQRAGAAARLKPLYPPFPREEQGQRVRFWAHVLGWLGRSAWVSLQRLPRWLRILVYVWVAILAMSRGWTPGLHDRSEISRADAQKLKAIADELSVSIASVKDGAVVWTRSYPVAIADATKIAEEINSKLPASPPDDD